MLTNSNGFTLIESLVALNIIVVAVLTIIPILSNIKFEQEVLYDRRLISSYLHDKHQFIIWDRASELPLSQTSLVNGISVNITFTFNNQFIKGCANWVNVKERDEEICFYGL